MNISITFRHMEHTPALDSMIREKSEKFLKWFGPQTEVRWTCFKDGHEFCSEVALQSSHGEFFAKAHADDLYKTFDLIVQKIQNQIK